MKYMKFIYPKSKFNKRTSIEGKKMIMLIGKSDINYYSINKFLLFSNASKASWVNTPYTNTQQKLD